MTLSNTLSILCILGLILTTNVSSNATCIYAKPLTANVEDGVSVLTWTTLTETNNQFFIVERSLDGITFEKAVQLEGAGQSDQQKKYRFVEIAAKFSRTFYRLVQVDYGGEVHISHTVVVSMKGEESLFNITAISAGATDRYFSLVLDSKADKELVYQVMTQLGDIKKSGKSSLIKGTNALAIDLSNLEVKTYQLSLSVGSETEVLHIRKEAGKLKPQLNLAKKNEADNKN